MLPGVEVARRRRMRAPAQRRELDPPSTHQLSSNSSFEGRRSRGSSNSGSSNLAHHHQHHHHHHHHHHHYHHHSSRSATRSPAALSTQVRRLQDLLQEHRAATSQQQNNNTSLLTSSITREGREVRSASGSRGLRGYRGEESRLSTLAMLLRGQAHERRLQGAAMEARDRLDERLRSAALPPRFAANSPRQAASSTGTMGITQYEMSVLFSDTEDDEHLWSDDEDWERTMREWLSAWAPSLEDRWQPDLFGGNHHHRSAAREGSYPAHKPRKGMSKDAIDAIKRETYGSKKAAESSRDQEDCPVCLEKFLAGQGLLALPCSHRFHPNCLTPWLEGHEKCPYCRARITEGLWPPVQQHQQQQPGRASGVETKNPSHTSYFVSWMSAVEQGMTRFSIGSS